ncbi:MAG: LytR C-terminal domain-containing protein, partial [Nocardioides sp.]
PSETVTDEPAKQRKKLERGEVYVEVYNNTGISGLAGRVGGTASDVGWQVVGTDNWYGTVPSTTVYYPDRLKRAAKVLARDLGVERTAPAEGEMKLDRLTLILTGEL